MPAPNLRYLSELPAHCRICRALSSSLQWTCKLHKQVVSAYQVCDDFKVSSHLEKAVNPRVTEN